MLLSAEETYASLVGAWRLMLGKAEGFRLLDLSADGFWNSFFSIVVAAPAMIVGWVGVADEIGQPDAVAARLGVILRLAAADIGAWVLPLIGLALVARRAGLADRFVHYVVASNWASAILAWVMLPSALLSLFLPYSDDVLMSVSLVLSILSLVLYWRMTNASIGKGAAVATAVFFAMFVAAQAVDTGLYLLLGVNGPGYSG